MAAVLKDAELTPVKIAKRKAESEYIDLTEDVGGININASTPSPLKKVKAVMESETKSQHASETKSETSETTATLKTALSTATGPEPQPKTATPERETKIEVTDASASSSSAPAPPDPTSPDQSMTQGSSGAAVGLIDAPASGSPSRPDGGDSHPASDDSDNWEDRYHEDDEDDSEEDYEDYYDSYDPADFPWAHHPDKLQEKKNGEDSEEDSEEDYEDYYDNYDPADFASDNPPDELQGKKKNGEDSEEDSEEDYEDYYEDDDDNDHDKPADNATVPDEPQEDNDEHDQEDYEDHDGNGYDDPADYATPPDEPEEDSEDDEDGEGNRHSGMDDYYNGVDLEFWDPADDYNPFDGYDPAPRGLEFWGALGLLNGRYDITAPSVLSAADNVDPSELSLVLTLRGTELWGQFDLGLVIGTLYFDERPWRASGVPLMLKWRGVHVDGRQFRGNGNEGCIQFLGGGRIRGLVAYDGQDIIFDGDRVSGQVTRSEIPARDMVWSWNEFS